MEIHYNLTEEDYINFNLYHIKNSETGKRALAVQRFLSPLFFIIISYVYAAISDMPFLPLFITFFIMSILWIIFYPKHFYKLIARNAKKMIKEGKNDGLIGHHQLKMTEEGLVDTSLNKETKVTWSGITSFKEDEGYYYLYNSSVSAYILPKREIDHADEVKQYIQSKVMNNG
ncbi:YcxB family protein [Sporosarcina sp. BP05]|uniref:YcxB family protein n=1 Tax=Sporosarcina sp. BP05 TaxID=2758726 RepID=UPI0016458680|nr:YcxB family protein [Sporosarcina sp. BP05]